MNATWIFLNAHWAVVSGILTPVAVATLSAFATEFGDPDHNPETPAPLWLVPFIALRDVLSLRVPRGRVGIMGSRWSIPGHYPRKKAKGLTLPPNGGKAAAMLPIIFALACVLPGCKTAGGNAILQCELATLSQSLKDAQPCIEAALARPDFMTAVLACKGLAKDQALCVIQAVTAAADAKAKTDGGTVGVNPVDINVATHGHLWLNAQKKK
jgi:hypothetical protein